MRVFSDIQPLCATGGWPRFDFYAGTATTEAAAPFAVFKRACPELRRRVRAPSVGSQTFSFVLPQPLPLRQTLSSAASFSPQPFIPQIDCRTQSRSDS